jgi:RNA polymerase sigma-70 factor (ECF subfamily)
VPFHEFDMNYLQRLREGDPETERHFIAYFGPLLLIKLRSRTRSVGLIDDIRQETFLRTFRAVRNTSEIREPERLGAFVCKVCNNVALEFFRFANRHPATTEESGELADKADIEKELITKERKRMVRQVIGDMPDKDRKLLRAVFLEEQDKDEVSTEFGVDRDYLRVLLHRAKQNFRERFLQAEGGRPQAMGKGK